MDNVSVQLNPAVGQQQRLFSAPPARRKTRATAEYQGQNIQAAQIIAGDPLLYGGLPLVWAEMVLTPGGGAR